MKKYPPKAQRSPSCPPQGFTLIEMSIVIAIIALIIGGIVISKSVINASRLQSVIADVNRYKQAVINFRDKFNYLPGDMPTATGIWSTTNNGNGDGFIGSQSTDPSNLITPNEMLQAWQQLSLAGFIEGQYVGRSSLTNFVAGKNVPGSRVPGAAFGLMYIYIGSGYTHLFPGIYNHILTFGVPEINGQTAAPDVYALTALDAWTLDSKIDDGLPGQGNVRTYNYSYNTHCASTNDQLTAAYQVTDGGWGNGLNCSLFFITGF